MAKAYRLGPATKVINHVFRAMTGLGADAPYRYVLTVRRRRSGRLLENDTFIRAPGDEANWPHEPDATMSEKQCVWRQPEADPSRSVLPMATVANFVEVPVIAGSGTSSADPLAVVLTLGRLPAHLLRNHCCAPLS